MPTTIQGLSANPDVEDPDIGNFFDTFVLMFYGKYCQKMNIILPS